MLKILFTVHQFFPGVRGGTETLTLEAAKCFRAMGHHVQIVTGYHADDIDDRTPDEHCYVYEDILIHALKPGKETFKRGGVRNFFTRNVRIEEQFARILDEWQPDIVHFFHLHHLSSGFADLCEERGVPVFMTPTAFWPICPYSKLLLPDGTDCAGPDHDSLNCLKHYLMTRKEKNPLARLLLRLSDPLLRITLPVFYRLFGRVHWPYFVANIVKNGQAIQAYYPGARRWMKKLTRILPPTRLMQQVLLENGVRPEKLEILPYGLNYDFHRCGPTKSPSSRLRVGYIGALNAYKGCHVLIDAVKQLPKGLPIDVMIYGDAVDTAYVRAISESSQQVPGIRFMGTFQNAEIGNILSELDLLVVPSIWLENAPLVIYSAQASGCPVIGSDVKGIRECVEHDKNGFLFPKGDSMRLSRLISHVSFNPDILDRLRRAAIRPSGIHDYCDRLLLEYQKATDGSFTP